VSKAVDRAAEQVYRGIWHGLVKWFKVPDQPPTLPNRPGEQLERFKPAEGFLRYLLLFFWIGLVVIDLVFLAIYLASFTIDWRLGLALLPVFMVVAILPDIVVYVAIHLRYDTTWYVLSDRSLRIRRGIWTITETTITFENVQDVKIDQGPIQRVYGISDVVVQTAGGGGSDHHGAGTTTHVGRIEGIADAARIRDLIMNRVRRSRSAGLGDEHETKPGHRSAPASFWTAGHLEVLREIRLGLSELRS
jgi:membrane protein YdbS with pleckstrin-like domain